MTRYVCIFAGCLLFHCMSYGQLSITGRVTDTAGNKLASLTVSLADNKGLILAYAITDATGFYQLSHPERKLPDTAWVYLRAYGFKADSFFVKSNKQEINFRLIPDRVTLQEVTVRAKQPIISKRGDTIRYNVDSFSHPQDRVIIDVIKKLPGIEVGENGEIKFQGKPINRLYVDGDNLVDGKYNAITNHLPNDLVASIEVLQNHQPVKALRDLDLSDIAGLNIVLKEKASVKLIAEGYAAAGTPSQYDISTNAMLFSKKVKMVSALQFANSGKDPQSDIFSHFDPGSDLKQQKPLLSNEVINPPLPAYRYLLHNATLADVNVLWKTKKATDIKFGASFINDRQENERSVRQLFFLPADTIQYAEKLLTNTNDLVFKPRLNITLNQNKYYLNNIFEAELRSQTAGTSVLSSVNGNIHENFNSKRENITNLLHLVKAASPKVVLEIYSFSLLGRSPQTNKVEPGLYASEINAGRPFNALIQSSGLPSFFTRNYAAAKIPGKIVQSYQLGVEWHKQQLQSTLSKQLMDGAVVFIADSFVNRLDWERTRLYAEAKFTHIANRFQYDLTVPFEYNFIHYSDSVLNNKTNRVFFQPSARIRFRVTKTSVLLLQSGLKNFIGDVTNVYESYILNGYRSFNSQGGVLPSGHTLSNTLSYEWNNIPSFFFLSASAGYSLMDKNSIPVYNYSAFTSRLQNMLLNNKMGNFNAGIRISKYIVPLRTTISLTSALAYSEFNQVQNGYLLKYKNKTRSLGVKVNSNIQSKLYFNYDGSFLTFINSPDASQSFATETQRSSSQVQKFDLTWLPVTGFSLTAGAEYYNSFLPGNNKNNFLFADLTLVYKSQKYKTDIQLSVFNVLDKKAYTIVNTGSNALNESSYQIKPRNAIIKIMYRL